MRRDRHDSELTAEKADKQWWRKVTIGLVVANVLLGAKVLTTDQTEKTIVVPPTIEKAFWVKGTEVAPEYLEEMARYLSTLMLNVTSKNVDGNIEVFLRYVAPESFGALKAKLNVKADRLKLGSYSTAWYPVDYQTKAKEKVVVIGGDFVTTVGKQVVSSDRRYFRLAYSFVGGRLWVTEFVEVSSEQPFGKPLDIDATVDAAGTQQQ